MTVWMKPPVGQIVSLDGIVIDNRVARKGYNQAQRDLSERLTHYKPQNRPDIACRGSWFGF